MDTNKLKIRWLFKEDLEKENIAACGVYADNTITIIKTPSKKKNEFDWIIYVNESILEERFDNKVAAIIWLETHFNDI